MDLQEKLKLLRREREARDRAQKIRDTWERLEGEDDGLSVKDKLERLINLTGTPHHPGSRKAPVPPPARRREPVEFHENAFLLGARYGQIPIALGLEVPGNVLSLLGRDAAFEGLDLGAAVFLDLETTGLSGGTGTVAFLVGLGYYRDERFKVAQFFLGDLAEEGRFIREVAQFVGDMGFRAVVTYNGKAFDVPLLETRFALHRTPFPFRDLPHLDFLFSARSLWRHKFDSCRLFTLAQEIAQAERAEDIPGAEIPLRYFQFVRSGDYSLIEPILYHNQEDILSLLSVVVAGAVLVDKNRDPGGRDETAAVDLYGVARLFEHRGDAATSAALLEKALGGALPAEISGEARKKLSRHFKRNKEWDKAVSLWQGESGGDEVCRCRELAMHFEHRAKDFAAALRAAEEGLAEASRLSHRDRQDFEKRIARLKGKIGRQNGARRPAPARKPASGGSR